MGQLSILVVFTLEVGLSFRSINPLRPDGSFLVQKTAISSRPHLLRIESARLIRIRRLLFVWQHFHILFPHCFGVFDSILQFNTDSPLPPSRQMTRHGAEARSLASKPCQSSEAEASVLRRS